MFEELIGNLRACSRCDFGQDCGKCTLKSSETTFCCDVLLHEAADAIEALEIKAETFKSAYIAEHNARIDEIKRHMWIPATDRLPEPMKDVVLFMRYGEYKQLSEFAVGYYDDKLSDFSYCDVTHWMPLPEPPESEGE